MTLVDETGYVETRFWSLRDYLATIGSRGGKKGGPARMAKLTAEERKELARKAIAARWRKAKRARREAR